MNTSQRKAMGQAIEALETAKNGLEWYRAEAPEQVDESDSEVDEQIVSAVTALRAELDAPATDDAKDAERYRWLRSESADTPAGYCVCDDAMNTLTEAELDATIDKAIAASAAKGETK